MRLSPDNTETLLQSRDNLKVIQLFRDPRAIINSRIETEWYPFKNVSSNAESLCKKMIYDYQEGQKLLKKYPARFRFVYYEDLLKDPLEKIKSVYRYLGMSLNESKYSNVRSVLMHSHKKLRRERDTNTAFWWRHKIKWDVVKKINNFCKHLYEALGYKAFVKNEMKNLTIKSVNIPPEYILK